MNLLTCPGHAHALMQAWQQTGMHRQHYGPLLLKFHNKEYCLWKHTNPLLSSQKPMQKIVMKKAHVKRQMLHNVVPFF
jgi:hypothetical protein